jgi:predicted nucleic acid-binding protein
VKLVDSSVVIDYLRDEARAVALLEPLVTDEQLFGSEMTRFEVLAGMRPVEEDATESILGTIGWIPVDEFVARRAASLVRRYRAAHRGIEDADYLIAATALELEADLLTTNARHFPMLPGLRAAY